VTQIFVSETLERGLLGLEATLPWFSQLRGSAAGYRRDGAY